MYFEGELVKVRLDIQSPNFMFYTSVLSLAFNT